MTYQQQLRLIYNQNKRVRLEVKDPDYNHIYDKLNMRANSWALISFKVHLRKYLLNNEINL